jgi:ribosomal protein L7Ae-like RNA K-turn-binding protein
VTPGEGPRAHHVEGLLGLAARARALVWGTERVRDAVRGGEVKFAIVAADASDNTKDKLLRLLESSGVPYVERYDRDSLGAAIGKAGVSAIGVTGSEFAARIGAVTHAVDAAAGPGTGD